MEEPQIRPGSDSHPVRYTVYSVIIFFVGLIAFRLVNYYAFRDYYMVTQNFSEYSLSILQDYMCVSLSDGMEITKVRMEKESAKPVLMYISGIEDKEAFVRDNLGFVYGDPDYDVRSQLFYYEDELYTNEYCDVYSSINTPYVTCRIFEDGDVYAAELSRSGDKSEIISVFDSVEKVYTGNNTGGISRLIENIFA